MHPITRDNPPMYPQKSIHTAIKGMETIGTVIRKALISKTIRNAYDTIAGEMPCLETYQRECTDPLVGEIIRTIFFEWSTLRERVFTLQEEKFLIDLQSTKATLERLEQQQEKQAEKTKKTQKKRKKTPTDAELLSSFKEIERAISAGDKSVLVDFVETHTKPILKRFCSLHSITISSSITKEAITRLIEEEIHTKQTIGPSLPESGSQQPSGSGWSTKTKKSQSKEEFKSDYRTIEQSLSAGNRDLLTEYVNLHTKVFLKDFCRVNNLNIDFRLNKKTISDRIEDEIRIKQVIFQ